MYRSGGKSVRKREAWKQYVFNIKDSYLRFYRSSKVSKDVGSRA